MDKGSTENVMWYRLSEEEGDCWIDTSEMSLGLKPGLTEPRALG